LFSKKIVTLNIESTDLRLLVIRGKRVEEWSSVSLEPGLVKEGLILDLPAVSRVISELMAGQGVKGKEIIASLSGFQSVQRLPDLPKLSPQLMGDALMREAKRTMPVPLEQLYLSWQAIEDGDESQRVFLLGIPRNLMDAEVQCLRQSGIDPHIMDLKPLALARMVNRPEALIIDIETESADIIIVSGGIPAMMRTLTMRSDQSLARRIQYLVEEFERTLQFYESSHPDEPLSRSTPLFLTGGLVRDVEIVQAVTAGIEYQVEPLASPLESPPDLPLSQYAVNIGLALKNVSSPRDGGIPDVNILPDVYRPRALTTKQILFVPTILAGLALIFPLYQLANSATTEVYRTEAEYNTISQQLQIRQLENQKIKQIEDAIAQVQQRRQNLAAKLKELSSGRSDIYDSLHLVAVDTLPANANLTSATLADSGLGLAGSAPSYEVALDYARALRQTGKFSRVWVNSLQAQDEDKVGFSITLE